MSRAFKHKAGYSLQRRLVLAFSVLLVAFLGLTGLVLDRAFKESVEAAVQERLQLHIYALLGVAEPDDDGFFLPGLEEARFAQIDSGLYGFILDEEGTELWRSPSALDMRLENLDLSIHSHSRGQTAYLDLETPRQGRMVGAVYASFWASQQQKYLFLVMESLQPTDAEIREFQSNLWFWLGGLTVLLCLVQIYLLRWGLLPLQRLARDVARVEAGDSEELADHYPSELTAVTENLNMLIRNERRRRERYRDTLGDLAHSLKTPLAVLSSLVQKKTPAQPEGAVPEINEQLDRMNQIVSYQLKRAVKSEAPVFARPVLVRPVVEKIVSALSKVYKDKEVQCEVKAAEEFSFYGDERDLTELCGNLLDNAYKYCAHRVQVSLVEAPEKLVISIEDDGEGIPESRRDWVLRRGARLDTVKSGQGIGMAVSMDILRQYGGELQIGASELGGAAITVSFLKP